MKLRYFPCYHDEWLVGQAGLDNACRGLYLTACLLIYSHGGPVPIEELRRNCRDHGLAFKRQFGCLIKMGKLIENDGRIDQERCENELRKRDKRSEDGEQNIAKRWNNNGLDSEVVLPHSNTNQNQNQNQKDKPNGLSKTSLRSVSSAREIADAMMAIFREECPALSPPSKATPTRLQQCHARLAELKTLDQWREVCQRVSCSPFLTGQETRWKACFDWLLKPANLVKVIEGNYDDERDQPDPQGGSDHDDAARQAGLEEALRQLRSAAAGEVRQAD
jgi:uncharacterized protein YdaU (DUF1376 family)